MYIKHKNSEILKCTLIFCFNTSIPNHTSHKKMTMTEIYTGRNIYFKLNYVFLQSYDKLDNEHHNNGQHSY